ncbi:Oidioi.mRNA.OKI2018_I69.chr2.g5322.t1.cds [Oikopleura dioica]|uniref:Oidioi.mRNA.OKI2018_I69.chr2.g5322.t1.cds n=1 Tax=Oikopleura dioica TaxID=34765 RepID=A0ABN7SZY5_OIKDI|nr:Oidioi.mRNA.OKI2018_I69.chr2.g5322.t1.cds [Oikopleura dioica]
MPRSFCASSVSGYESESYLSEETENTVTVNIETLGRIAELEDENQKLSKKVCFLMAKTNEGEFERKENAEMIEEHRRKIAALEKKLEALDNSIDSQELNMKAQDDARELREEEYEQLREEVTKNSRRIKELERETRTFVVKGPRKICIPLERSKKIAENKLERINELPSPAATPPETPTVSPAATPPESPTVSPCATPPDSPLPSSSSLPYFGLY